MLKRALIALAAVALIAGGVVAVAQAVVTSATPTACVKPTGSISHQKMLNYNECRFDELLALHPVPTVTVTETETVTASPTVEPSPSPSPDPSPTPDPSPSPTPSPTPDPTPTEPPSTGFPDASNTGPTGPLTAYTGPSTISTPGTVIESKILGCIAVTAGDVVIRNSRISCGPGYAAVYVEDKDWTGAPLLLEDVEIDCQDSNSTAVGEANVTVRRADIHGCENGFDVNQNITIEDSYIHDLYNGGDAHMDGVQLAWGHWNGSGYDQGARDVVIRHNTILAVDPAGNLGTSAIISNPAGDENILIEGNLLGGGAYTLYCDRPGSGSNYRVIDNHFTKAFSPKYGAFGPSDDCADETLSGNVDHETGQPLALD